MRELDKNLNENIDKNNTYHQFDFLKGITFRGTEIKNNYFLNINFHHVMAISGWKIRDCKIVCVRMNDSLNLFL